jgi:hypothetical protein
MPFLSRFLIFVLITLVVGFGSAWRFVDHGFFATTYRFGPWSMWFREGTQDADPYTTAHVARQGSLPINATSYISFTATRDSSGSRLYGECTYEIRGYSLRAIWWNIAAFRRNGELIPNKTGRSSFASNTILTAPDGSFVVRLSPDVQPGNWLPSTKGERVVLRLNILRPLNADNLLQSAKKVLPEITLMECA